VIARALAFAWVLAGLVSPAFSVAAAGDAKVVALGVQAGPALVTASKQPALALVVNERIYLVDAGNDTVAQMRAAPLSFASLRHVFFTHHHADHVAGYPALVALGQHHPQPYPRLDAWGPPPLAKMHQAVLDFFAADDASFTMSTGKVPMASKAFAHELDLPATGVTKVFEDGYVAVSATRVFHDVDVPHAYAYRFDVKKAGTSVVFSGDTAPTDALVALAKDASLLVHEAMFVPGVEELERQVPPQLWPGLRKHILASHTDVRAIPALAKRANVRHVALTHYTPIEPASLWRREFGRAAARAGYRGSLTPLRDLQEISLRAAARGR
jgi:ribonuclease BN (tRNA processing enzyme)